MPELPTGTITFLFTDIEGSTVRWERFPEEMRPALVRHDEIMRACLEGHGGIVFKTVGDAFYAAFASATSAIYAAIDAQETLAREIWNKRIGQIRVRIAVHTGEAEYRDNDYFGPALNRVARLLATGYGEQILLSLTTAGLVRDKLPANALLKDLGIHHLKDIQRPEHIFQVIVQGLRESFPLLKTLDQHPNNLPAQLTSFIGRQNDLDAVGLLLQRDDIRLVTLVGPGGVGKTRLGIQVATEIAKEFPNGIYFVDIATVHDSQGAIDALAQILGICKSEKHSLLEQIKKSLQGKVLLLFDNVEQVLDAAQIIREILFDVRTVTILVTSRTALHLDGEHEYRVTTLSVPKYKQLSKDLAELAQYEAISLFIQQAKAVKADFCLTNANASAIAEICIQLDGLPLAIELAAARVNLLPPQSLVKRLGQRLQLLNGKARHPSERRPTLRGTIEWSYNLLNPYEKKLFQQLAAFRKGCTLEAAEYICQPSANEDGDLLDGLHSLIDKSLIRLRELEESEPRFEMLYTMREFALEQVQKETLETLRLRHAEYYLTLMEQLGPPPLGNEQIQWLIRLETEYENVLDALHWCSEHSKIEYGLRLAETLWHFWWLRGRLNEGQQWFEKLFDTLIRENLTIPTDIKAKALERASELACRQNDLVNAQAWAEEALRLSQQLDEKETMSKAYVALANIAMQQEKNQLVSAFLEESLKLRQALGDARGMASLLNNLGNVARKEGNFERAALLHERSLTYFRQLGDEVATAAVLNNLAEVEWCRGHGARAQGLYRESLKLSRAIQYSWGIASSLVGLGDIAYASAEYDVAKSMYKESLLLFQEMDDRVGIVACLEGLTTILKSQHYNEAVQKPDLQAEVVGYSINPLLPPDSSLMLTENLHAELGDWLFNALREAGHIPSMKASIMDAFKDF
ncbi:MAG TPA: tetratricopeptide repeat protein [Ktedonobacteraceae bacterium]|nr:tetratricopeptide repeat protein [Ktedonobacteraceae bacterium]